MNPYWDSSASGILVGLRGHHRSGHIFRAALEGIAFELRLHFEGLESALSSPIQELVVSGGGSQSPLWLQIIADVTQKIVNRKVDNEAASLGAAILAVQTTGFFSNMTEAINAMTGEIQSSYSPSPLTQNVYTQQYSLSYRPLYPAIRSQLKALEK
jgi:xylulokinase